jgi:hypothetical protein
MVMKNSGDTKEFIELLNKGFIDFTVRSGKPMKVREYTEWNDRCV